MNEAARQRDLLAALAAGAPPLVALRESGERAARGLEAYRANAEAIAERALAASFATVQAMVGEHDFKQLAREFRRDHPPVRGDLGEWGDALPDWLAAHAGLRAWPWLADSARLDLAVHRCERAEDAALDADSLGLLESADPAQMRLVPVPGSALLRSAWPIATIHRAHQLEGEAAEAAFAAVREAVAAHRGETVLVARRGWRAAVHVLDDATAAWTQDLLRGASLDAALSRAGEGFDFAAWLATALRESWLRGAVLQAPTGRAA
jgi:Putative DNA-binding domain